MKCPQNASNNIMSKDNSLLNITPKLLNHKHIKDDDNF